MQRTHSARMAAVADVPLHCGLPVLLWLVQFVTIAVYVYTVTCTVAAIAAKGDLGLFGPCYLAILVFFFLTFLLLGNEAVFLLRQTLTPLLYLNSQIAKVALFIVTLLSIELLGLAWKTHEMDHLQGMLGNVVGLTLLASIPFSLSLILALAVRKSRLSGIAIVVSAVDEHADADGDLEQGERRPLLPAHPARVDTAIRD